MGHLAIRNGHPVHRRRPVSRHPRAAVADLRHGHDSRGADAHVPRPAGQRRENRREIMAVSVFHGVHDLRVAADHQQRAKLFGGDPAWRARRLPLSVHGDRLVALGHLRTVAPWRPQDVA